MTLYRMNSQPAVVVWPLPWAEVRRARGREEKRDPHTLSAVEQDRVPAVVEYLPGRRVRVSHPLGAQHENAVLTCRRLARQGFHILTEK